MEFKNFHRYQHLNSLLVKCSEAGNLAAQFLLGKVILVSSSQLRDLLCDLDTNIPAQNCEVYSFMTYFLPKQVSTTESSHTRLVHYQLVKLFFLNGSHHDFAEMSVFIESYIKYFTRLTGEDNPLLVTIKALVSHAYMIGYYETVLVQFTANYRSLGQSFHDAAYNGLAEFRT